MTTPETKHQKGKWSTAIGYAILCWLSVLLIALILGWAGWIGTGRTAQFGTVIASVLAGTLGYEWSRSRGR